MTSALAEPSVSLARGYQKPRIHTGPKFSSSAGRDAVELAASAGLVLDEWQAFVLEHALGERPDGKWAAFEVALLVSRQNGKGSVLEARELAGLFLFDEGLILHSAHEFKTAQEAFRRVLTLVQNTPDLDREVARVRTSHGEEGIELKSGQRLRFVARSTGSGRGFTGDCIVLDEAYNLDERAMSALLPTLSARPNPQLWYASSAPLRDSTQLHAVRERGIEGSKGLAFFEWSAASPDDRDAVEQANPALGIRIPGEFVEREQAAMPAESWNRERLGIPDKPPGAGSGALDLGKWLTLAAEPPPLTGPVFGVDLDSAGIGYFAVAWKRPDGHPHVQLAGRSTASKLQDRARELTGKHGGQVFAGGPALKLIDDAEPVSNADFAASCRRIADLLAAGEIFHCAEAELDESVAQATWRTASTDGTQAWQLKDVPGIGPLAAVTRAIHGLMDETPPTVW